MNTHKPRSVAAYLNWQIELSGKMQIEIAEEVGFSKPNIITMIKQGKTLLPRDKVSKMAKAISIDPLYLFKMVWQEYYPTEWTMLEEILGQTPITASEQEMLRIIRQNGPSNIRMFIEDKKRIAEFAKTLMAG